MELCFGDLEWTGIHVRSYLMLQLLCFPTGSLLLGMWTYSVFPSVWLSYVPQRLNKHPEFEGVIFTDAWLRISSLYFRFSRTREMIGLLSVSTEKAQRSSDPSKSSAVQGSPIPRAPCSFEADKSRYRMARHTKNHCDWGVCFSTQASYSSFLSSSTFVQTEPFVCDISCAELSKMYAGGPQSVG